MSAWYLFSVLGFYPLCPGSDAYAIGSPAVPRAEVHLSHGETLTVTAVNLLQKNIDIQSTRLHGTPHSFPTAS